MTAGLPPLDIGVDQQERPASRASNCQTLSYGILTGGVLACVGLVMMALLPKDALGTKFVSLGHFRPMPARMGVSLGSGLIPVGRNAAKVQMKTMGALLYPDEYDDAEDQVAKIQTTVSDKTEEERAQIEADARAVFTVIDLNGDGEISRPELVAHLMKSGYTEGSVNLMFGKLDVDSSDTLTLEELTAGFLKYSPLRESPGLGHYNQQFVDEIHQDADNLFSAIDVNNDGKISKDELRAYLEDFSEYTSKAISKLFKLLDVNKDGSIEREEMRDAFVKFSALRQAIGFGPNYK